MGFQIHTRMFGCRDRCYLRTFPTETKRNKKTQMERLFSQKHDCLKCAQTCFPCRRLPSILTPRHGYMRDGLSAWCIVATYKSTSQRWQKKVNTWTCYKSLISGSGGTITCETTWAYDASWPLTKALHTSQRWQKRMNTWNTWICYKSLISNKLNIPIAQ